MFLVIMPSLKRILNLKTQVIVHFFFLISVVFTAGSEDAEDESPAITHV